MSINVLSCHIPVYKRIFVYMQLDILLCLMDNLHHRPIFDPVNKMKFPERTF